MKSIFYKVILSLGFALIRLVLKRIEQLDLNTSGGLHEDWDYLIFKTETTKSEYLGVWKDLHEQFKQESKAKRQS